MFVERWPKDIKDKNLIMISISALQIGQKVDFHHFPQFDPEDGNPGDTLIWYPTKHLKIASFRPGSGHFKFL